MTSSSDIGSPAGPLVACAGVAVLDAIYRVDEPPVQGEKNRARAMVQSVGGCAANAAIAVQRLGGQSRLASVLGGPAGRDTIGDAILAALEREGVDTCQIMRVHGLDSPLSAIMVDARGERTIVHHRHPDLTEARFTDPQAIVAGAHALLIDNRHPGLVTGVAQAANRAGLPVIVDAERPMTRKDPLLALASHIVFPAASLRESAGQRELGPALQSLRNWTAAFLAVTDGSRDILWLDGAKIRHHAAFCVPVADTLAAGDIFHGAFALALVEKQTEAEALRFAAATAALKCTRFGGGSAAPHRGEVMEFLASLAAI